MRPSPWSRKPRFPRRLGIVLTLAILALGGALAAWLQPASPISGHAEIIDGDTLRFGSARIRLLGLDAPELDQTCTDENGAQWACGQQAKSFVIGLVAHRTTTCLRTGRDRYGRALAKCAVDGNDLGNAIVAAGWAVTELDYLPAQTDARLARRGIWSGSFDSPANWRASHGSGQPGFWEAIKAWFQ